MQRRHRQHLERARRHGGGGRFGQPRHGVDLAPPVIGGQDDRHDLHRRVAADHPRAPTGHERLIGKDLGQRAQRPCPEAPASRYWPTGSCRRADGHHRQADAFARSVRLADIVETPENAGLRAGDDDPDRSARRQDGFLRAVAVPQGGGLARHDGGGVGKKPAKAWATWPGTVSPMRASAAAFCARIACRPDRSAPTAPGRP
jgi:hypothetical protein